MVPKPADAEVINSGPAQTGRWDKPLSEAQAARRAELIATLHAAAPTPDDAETMQYWASGTYFAFKPQSAWDDWLSQHIARTMVKLNGAERAEKMLRDLQSLRAIDCWETDQRLAAEETARHLVRHPRQTYGRLIDSVAGCDWLIARWEELVKVAPTEWTEGQRALAGLIQPWGPDEAMSPGFVAERLRTLRDCKASLLAADAVRRDLVAKGLASEVSPALAQHRRDTRALQRQLKWYVAQLRQPLPKRWDNPRFFPQYVPQQADNSAEASPPQAVTAPAPNEPIAAEAVEPVSPPPPETKPPADLAAEAPSGGETEPAADPVGENRPQPKPRQRFEDLPDEAKAARVEERKRRIDPERVADRIRRANRRSA